MAGKTEIAASGKNRRTEEKRSGKFLEDRKVP